MDPGVALQAVLSGLAQGSVYGLVALGFTLVYRLTRVLSFAHGDLITGALFLALLVTVGRTPVVTAPSLLAGATQTLAALAFGAALSVLLYVAAIRPFLGGGDDDGGSSTSPRRVTGWVVATVAAGLLLREGLGLVFTREAYAVADPLRLDRVGGEAGVLRLPGEQTLPVRVIGVLAVALLVALVVERTVVATRVGRAMRAVADDPQTASLMGIPTQRMVLLAFTLAGALAGLAAVLVAPGARVGVGVGVLLGLKGAAAALLGRLGSLRGAIVGGLVLGTAEALAVSSTGLGPAYADVLPLAVLVTVLAWRPEGLRAAPAGAAE